MINIKQSNHHMIFYPHKNAFDKYIIQHIVKTFIQSNSFNYEHEKNKFKVVVINNVESLNYLTQMSLRRTMEEYNSNCRFVFISNSINNIDYEDIYDNINDYEYPYNHINREGV